MVLGVSRLWRFVAGNFSDGDHGQEKLFVPRRSRALLPPRPVWYLCYHEHGPRVGLDREAAKQLAAQINAQLEVGAPAALSFEPIAILDLRERWLQHHEQVRSSVQTINRYRTATEHLHRFVATVRPVRYASHFGNHHAEEFVRHLRIIQVAANGLKNTLKRPLMES